MQVKHQMEQDNNNEEFMRLMGRMEAWEIVFSLVKSNANIRHRIYKLHQEGGFQYLTNKNKSTINEYCTKLYITLTEEKNENKSLMRLIQQDVMEIKELIK